MELSSKKLFGNHVKEFSLFPHQVAANEWMRTIEYNVGNPTFLKGGILSDDMGFGKTRSVAAMVAASGRVN